MFNAIQHTEKVIGQSISHVRQIFSTDSIWSNGRMAFFAPDFSFPSVKGYGWEGCTSSWQSMSDEISDDCTSFFLVSCVLLLPPRTPFVLKRSQDGRNIPYNMLAGDSLEILGNLWIYAYGGWVNDPGCNRNSIGLDILDWFW
jgi:hypothetical protein